MTDLMTDPMTSRKSERVSGAQITNWLAEWVAERLECPAAAIDPDAALADFRLDSVDLFALCCDIEDTFELIIEPIVLWHVATLRALTPYLTNLVNNLS